MGFVKHQQPQPQAHPVLLVSAHSVRLAACSSSCAALPASEQQGFWEPARSLTGQLRGHRARPATTATCHRRAPPETQPLGRGFLVGSRYPREGVWFLVKPTARCQHTQLAMCYSCSSHCLTQHVPHSLSRALHQPTPRMPTKESLKHHAHPPLPPTAPW